MTIRRNKRRRYPPAKRAAAAMRTMDAVVVHVDGLLEESKSRCRWAWIAGAVGWGVAVLLAARNQ